MYFVIYQRAGGLFKSIRNWKSMMITRKLWYLSHWLLQILESKWVASYSRANQAVNDWTPTSLPQWISRPISPLWVFLSFPKYAMRFSHASMHLCTRFILPGTSHHLFFRLLTKCSSQVSSSVTLSGCHWVTLGWTERVPCKGTLNILYCGT